MTTPMVVHRHWADTFMYLCERAPEDLTQRPAMDALGGSCRELGAHPALARHSGAEAPVYPEVAGAGSGAESGTLRCAASSSSTTSSVIPPPPPPPPPSAGAAVAYGYPFGAPYYEGKVPYPPGISLPAAPLKAYQHPADKFGEHLASNAPAGEEIAAAAAAAARAKEFPFYPSFAGAYQPVSATNYFDMSVVPAMGVSHAEARHDTILPVEPYPHWTLSNGWDGQICCAKEQAQTCHIWKAPFPDIVPLQSEGGTYRRGRKKRVPYTKVQLKELEREYAASRFITKEKRRKISASVNLSERQVTIWFQNRRVKEKKVDGKSKPSHLHTT
uniref:homeobox protein Hox-C13a-like n=1 Tax=Pristiophorus japonicus TaxID=55135 RepID=UPI00398F89FE